MTTQSDLSRLTQLFQDAKEQMLSDYFTYLQFQSISSEPEFKSQVSDCALWLKQYLEESSFEVDLWDGQGHPVVFAQNLEAGPEKPTVLFYGHYDVQPVDPLELWESPPFKPVLKDGEVYARGAQDNKGQTMYTLAALKALATDSGRPPVNIKLCLDGEEECGSTSLREQLKTQHEQLQADYLAIVDLGMVDESEPTVSLGLRGMAALTMVLTGSETDLHSGVHGGIAYNPNHALVEILAALRDKSGRIGVPGFYDDVIDLPEDFRRSLKPGMAPDRYEQLFGARPCGGETEFTMQESGTIRPTLELNGINGGYTGDGLKTVIPAQASANISCRLVPNQDPEHIRDLLIKHIKDLVPEGISVDFPGIIEGGRPVRSDPESKIVKAVAQAYSEISGTPTGFQLEGASVPIIAELANAAGAEPVMMGWGLVGDNIHAPNEHFSLQRLEKGFITIVRMLEIVGTPAD